MCLKRQFGLVENLGKRVKHAEEGVSKLMLDVYRTYASKLSHQTLFRWHKALFLGEKKISIGAYRTHKEPMQIVSGNLVRPTVHFQAPPSKDVPYEMDRFITWFNATHPDGKQPLPCLIRASIAHLYFEAIHPFEDGNGRIGRALIKKVISQHTKSPTLLSLSHLIYKQSKQYYRQLELHNQTLNVDGWIEFFSNLIVDAQKNTIALMEFVIYKSKVFLEFGFQLNERQVKVLHRLFEAGPEGFKGGLSAKNYRSISKASPATVTRDLRELVALGILYSKGEKKMTRYYFKR